jgi:hypothetical protein
MPKLHLHLLGSPKVEIDGQTAVIPRRKTMALLIYAATQTITRKYKALSRLETDGVGKLLGMRGRRGNGRCRHHHQLYHRANLVEAA